MSKQRGERRETAMAETAQAAPARTPKAQDSKSPLDRTDSEALDSTQVEATEETIEMPVHTPRQALINIRRHAEGLVQSIDRALKIPR